VVKGKILGGAPRTGRWTRQPEDTRLGGRHRGSIIALLVLAVVVLGGIGAYLFFADQRLREGLLAQEREARQRPDWVALADLPPHVRHAFAAVVDTTFFTRRSLRRGESEVTLSRQLVRQVHRLDGSLAGEAQELAMAPILEVRRPPQRLLELYVNRVALGRTDNWSVFGAQHAARDFFGKDVRTISASEAAALAGILLPPRMQDPDAHPGPVGARRNEVLRRMRLAGHLDDAAYLAALREPLGFQPGIEHAPMSRPEGWQGEPEVIRLPEELRPRPEPEPAG
jgi:membrane peptidoglycan carboxypeptidase